MTASTTMPRFGSEAANRLSIEDGMIALFAPCTREPLPKHTKEGSFWRLDSIHRAKNLSQLMISLADVGEHPSRRWLSPDLATKTRTLSRAYDELGEDTGSNEPVPCAPLLTEIATRLGQIFGQARGIEVQVEADGVSLNSGLRRALTLICSELIINSLKYGYPDGSGGIIRVRLATQGARVVLVVEDDGIGTVSDFLPGHGSALLHRLSDVLGAIISRDVPAAGHGYHVLVKIPSDPETEDQICRS